MCLVTHVLRHSERKVGSNLYNQKIIKDNPYLKSSLLISIFPPGEISITNKIAKMNIIFHNSPSISTE